MKDGAIICNTGHFNVEIDIPALRDLAVETHEARNFVEEFKLADGRRLYLLAEGRLVNISAAEGHPALVMDMSFANQALATEYAVLNASSLEQQRVPRAGRDRRGDRPAQARDDGCGDRPAHRRAGRRTSPPGTRAPDRARTHPAPGSRRGRPARPASASEAEEEVRCQNAAEVAEAIRTMVVRGAPAIGIAAAYGIALAAAQGDDLDEADDVLRRSRPTAVNLAWALDGCGATRAPSTRGRSTPTRSSAAARWRARTAELFAPGTRVAHPLQRGRARDRRLRQRGRSAPCRRGRAAASRTSSVDETRPLLQGARLTAWELEAAGDSAQP